MAFSLSSCIVESQISHSPKIDAVLTTVASDHSINQLDNEDSETERTENGKDNDSVNNEFPHPRESHISQFPTTVSSLFTIALSQLGNEDRKREMKIENGGNDVANNEAEEQ